MDKIQTQGLDDTKLTVENKKSRNFTKQLKKFCLCLHYNRVNSYVFVKCVEIYKFKAKDSKINVTPLCLANFSKDFLVGYMKETG